MNSQLFPNKVTDNTKSQIVSKHTYKIKSKICSNIFTNTIKSQTCSKVNTCKLNNQLFSTHNADNMKSLKSIY